MADEDQNTTGGFRETIKWVQELFTLVVGGATIATGIGFIVINVHLATKFSVGIGYIVTPAQYLTAGILPVTLAIVFGTLAGWTYSNLSDLFYMLRHRTPSTERKPKNRRIFYFLIIVLYFVFDFSRGFAPYGAWPVLLGGGKPAGIILIFEDQRVPKLLQLPVDNNQPERTQELEFLAELVDGVLVRDPATNHVVAVKNEYLIGRANNIVPATPAPSTPTLAPTPTP